MLVTNNDAKNCANRAYFIGDIQDFLTFQCKLKKDNYRFFGQCEFSKFTIMTSKVIHFLYINNKIWSQVFLEKLIFLVSPLK